MGEDKTYARKSEVAGALLARGARREVVSSLTGLSDARIRGLRRLYLRKGSRAPSRHYRSDWFLQTDERRIDAALFYQLYITTRNAHRNVDRADAFLRAYEAWTEIQRIGEHCIDTSMSINVAYQLIFEFIDHRELALRTCKTPTCKVHFLARYSDAGTLCPVCEDTLKHVCKKCRSIIPVSERRPRNSPGADYSYCAKCHPRDKRKSPGPHEINAGKAEEQRAVSTNAIANSPRLAQN